MSQARHTSGKSHAHLRNPYACFSIPSASQCHLCHFRDNFFKHILVISWAHLRPSSCNFYTLSGRSQVPRPSPGTSQAHLRHLSGKSLAYLVRIPCICQVYLNFILSIFPLHLRNISCITQISLLQNSDKFHANPLNISQYNPVPCTCYNRKCLVG